MGNNRTILAIDDEPKILELLKSYLNMNGYIALCAKNSGEGMSLFEKSENSPSPVSLILLDLMLPDSSGEDFCKKIRQRSKVPIIMITAKADEASIIYGLKAGADDYVCKPFSPRQLMARIEAVLRRHEGNEAAQISPVLSYRELTMDREKRSVRKGEISLNLTRDEYNILELLLSNQAKIFTRDEILDAVKGNNYDGFDRAIDTHIKKLRAKIGDNPKDPKYISTIYGMGYRLGADQ